MDACEFKHLYCTAVLLAACIVNCALAQTEAPDVNFTEKPEDLYEYFNEADALSIAPVLNCQISGLTDEMEVVWLRNDLAIHKDEYTAKNYSLLRNFTDGDYDLEISRNITLKDDRDKYCCAVYFVANISQSHERTLSKKICARVKIYYFARERNPQCSISVTSPHASYKEGIGFTLECCMESWNLHIQMSWERNRNSGFTLIAGKNVSRKSEMYLRKCISHDVTDHQEGDMYQCLTTISQFSLNRANRQLQQSGANLDSVRQKSCTFKERHTILEKQDNDDQEDDPTFSCYSSGANYIWSFVPNLDEKNQYHMSVDRSTVLLNLDTLRDTEYNITCTAVGEDSIGSTTLNVEIRQLELTMQNVFKIIAISLGVVVVLFFILLIVYFVKTRLSFICEENRSRNLTPQEMRARIQIRRNMAGNSSGLYAFPSSRMASSSITPLMEGPEEGASSAEHSSPKPPRPGLIPDTRHLEGAVGGAILDEEDMIECEYRDEFECDPKSMNVEGLQYADLEFSSDEEDYVVEGGEEELAEASETVGLDKGEKPKINYADIVHFDPRRNSDPRRKSTST